MRKKPSFFSRFWHKLNNPPNWVALIIYATAIIACPLMIAAVSLDILNGIYAFIAYTVCALILLYAGYVATISVLRLRRKIIEEADKFAFTRKMHKSYAFRTSVFVGLSLIVNLGYTVFFAVMAFSGSSTWYAALALYSVLLVATKTGMLIENAMDEYRYKYDAEKLYKGKIGTYRYCGVMIVVLGLALAVSVVQIVRDGAGLHLPTWALYPTVLFTIYRVVMAAINMARSSRFDDMVVRAAKNVNMSAAVVSILTLQTAILAVVQPSFNPRTLNAVTGVIVCIGLMSLGIIMVAYSHKAKRRLSGAQRRNEYRRKEHSLGYNRDGYKEEYQGKTNCPKSAWEDYVGDGETQWKGKS